MSTSKLVYTAPRGWVSPEEHARRLARMSGAPMAPPVVKCRLCGYDKQLGTPCGLPCI